MSPHVLPEPGKILQYKHAQLATTLVVNAQLQEPITVQLVK